MKKLFLLLCVASSSLFAQLSIDPVNSVCRDAAPFNLNANQPGGYWSGWGITDTVNGLFDPQGIPNWQNNVTVAYHLGNDSAVIQIALKTAPSLWTPKTDITLCTGQSVVLHAYQYNCTNVLWTGDANSTDTAITVTNPGSYTVQGENDGCFSAPITYTVTAGDTLKDFYPEQYASVDCAIPVILTCGNNNVVWSNNAQGDNIQVSTPGKYGYYVNNNGCIQLGVFNVQQGNNSLSVNIQDEHVCVGNSAILNTGLNSQDYTFMWSTGETTSSITAPIGDYFVEVTKGNCIAYDSVHVFDGQGILPVYINNDTLCGANTVTLYSGYDAQQYSILWSTGETTSSIDVTIGTYSVTVSDGNCASGQATVNVYDGATVKHAPIEDIRSCFQTAKLQAPWNNLSSASWSDDNGLISNSIFANANHEGNYYLHEVLNNGCEFRDTVNVTLGNLDTNATQNLVSSHYVNFCEGSTATVTSTGTHQGYSWTKYNYNTQQDDVVSTSQNLVISEEGQYYLTVDEGTCSYGTTVYAASMVCSQGLDIANKYITSNAARPGFATNTFASVQNIGNQSISNCTYELTFDDTKLTSNVNGYTTSGVTINGNKASVAIPTLQTGEQFYVEVDFMVNVDVSLLGQELVYTSSVSCVDQEIDITNNDLNTTRIIGGAYDPNYVISNYGDGDIADSTSFIKYDIGFQNTGTDTAFTVVVKNKIDTNVFDLSTIKILGSTDNYTMGIDNDGMITWTFNNILLPDSNVDEHGSHGQLQFIIQLKSNLKAGTVLKDSANIYFDFNPPITTNTAFNNLVAQTTAVTEVNKSSLNLSVYPNPANDNATLVIRNFDGKGNVVVSFVDVTGKEVLAPMVTNNFNQTTSIQFSTENLSNGLYFVRVTNESQNQSISIVIQH